MSTRSLGTLTLDLIARLGGFEQGMDKAARISQKRAKEMQKAFQDTAKNIVGAIAAMDIGRRIGSALGEAINRMDELDEMAQKVGISVEKLSGLEFAGKHEGIEDFTGALVKLNKSVAEAASNLKSEQAAAFSALGVSVTDAGGKLKTTDVILEAVAQRFSEIEDGIGKTNAAIALFGKSGADLIPFLNGGADGLRRLQEQARVLGLIVSKETAASAAEFKDNLFLLQSASQGLATQVQAELLPVMRDLSGQMVDYATDAQNAENASRALEVGLKLILSTIIVLQQGFSVLGTTIGTVIGTVARAVENADLNITDLWAPKAIFKIAMAAKDESASLVSTLTNLGDESQKSWDRIQKIWEAGAAGIAKKPPPNAGGGKELFEFLGALTGDKSKKDPKTDAEKQIEAIEQFLGALDEQVATLGLSEEALARYKLGLLGATQAQQDYAVSQIRSIETHKQRVEQLQKDLDLSKQNAQALEEFKKSTRSAEEVAWDSWQQIRDVILATTHAGSEERAQLLLRAERKLSDDLLDIQNDRLKEEQDAERHALELRQRMEEEYNKLLQQDPLMRLLGIDSVEDTLEPVKAAMLDLADTTNQAFGSAVKSSADLIANVTLWGGKGKEAAKAIARTLLTDTVSGFIQAGAKAAWFYALQQRGIVSTSAAGQAAAIQSAQVQSAANAQIAATAAPAAAGTTLASFGTNIPLALAGIAAVFALTKSFGGGRAAGGSVGRGSLYEVGEFGRPELLDAGGKTYLIPGNEGGYVRPAVNYTPMEMPAGARNLGGREIINTAPGIKITPRAGRVYIDMLPEWLEMAREYVTEGIAADMLDADSEIGRSFSSRVGAPAGNY